MPTLRRFWLRFDIPEGSGLRYLAGLGCGVTAPDLEAALGMVRESIFHGQDLPALTEVIEDVDVSTLDPNHVLPNIVAPPCNLGIWYPMGCYSWESTMRRSD